MNIKYYIKKQYIGAVIFIIFQIVFWDIGENWLWWFIFSAVNFLLFPFSKHIVESLALRYTTKEFWTKGLFMSTPGKSGMIGMLDFIFFVLAVPLGLVTLIQLVVEAQRK